MIILYAYPQMFGLPDNNPFGLKVDAFLRLANIHYQLENTLDVQYAPRGQLPYIVDGEKRITDSNHIIRYLSETYHVDVDDRLTETQKNIHFLITRMLDTHLYWVISYSRWQDERFWPLFKAEFLRQLPQTPDTALEQAKKYNIKKYHYQGIGRYEPNDVYQSGINDLQVIGSILGDNQFVLGEELHSIDACCYGFLANILYFEIDTPLKNFITKDIALERYINTVRESLHY